MTDTVLPFPRRRGATASADMPRAKAAAALRSCLAHLAEEAECSGLPLTAMAISLAVQSIQHDLERGSDRPSDDSVGAKRPPGGD